MLMFNDISWGSKDNKIECESNVQLVSLLARIFGAGQWSFLYLVSEKTWYSISEDHSQNADIQPSVPRVHFPEVSSKAKAVENCRSTFVPTKTRLQLFFAQLLL